MLQEKIQHDIETLTQYGSYISLDSTVKPMKEYTVGFVFSESEGSVLLIKKNRPSWQTGKLNGCGGKIDPEDISPAHGISRECFEETGLGIPPVAWDLFCTLSGCDADRARVGARLGGRFKIYFFKTYTDTIWDAVSKTDEEVVIINVDRVDFEPTLLNLRWLIPMALSMNGDSVQRFNINEVNFAEKSSTN